MDAAKPVEPPTSIEFLDALKTLAEYTEVIAGLFDTSNESRPAPKITLEYFGLTYEGFCYSVFIRSHLTESLKLISAAIPANCDPIILYYYGMEEDDKIICRNQSEFEKALIKSVEQPGIKDGLAFLRSFFQ